MINTNKVIKNIIGKQKVVKRRKLKQTNGKTITTHDIFNPIIVREEAPLVERTTHGTLSFPQTKTIQTYEKPLRLAGKFKDLFKYGNHIKIISRRGEVVREIERINDKVKYDPKGGAQIIYINVNNDIYYEEWFMDNGSFLFDAPKELIGFKGQLLKIMTEGDIIEVVK